MFEDFYTMSVDGKGSKLMALRTTAVGMEKPQTIYGNGTYHGVEFGVNAGTIATLTGRAKWLADGRYLLQVSYLNSWGYIDNKYMSDWRYVNLINTSETYSAQNSLNELIKNNMHILENNLACARIIDELKRDGRLIPSQHKQKLYDLHYRLLNRDQELKKSNAITEFKEGTSPTLGRYGQQLYDFMTNPRIGEIVITTTVAVITIATIIVFVGATTWLLINRMNKESRVDFKYSDELLADLIKYLPPEVRNKLFAENKGFEETANNAIISAGRSGSLTGTLKTIGYAVAGLLLFPIIRDFTKK